MRFERVLQLFKRIKRFARARFRAGLEAGERIDAVVERKLERLGQRESAVAGAGDLAAENARLVAADGNEFARFFQRCADLVLHHRDGAGIGDEDKTGISAADAVEHRFGERSGHVGAPADMKLRVGKAQRVVCAQDEKRELVHRAGAVRQRAAQIHRFAVERVARQRMEFLEEILPHLGHLPAREAAAFQIAAHEAQIEPIQPAERAQAFAFDFLLQDMPHIRQL